MSEVFFEELGIPKPCYNLGVGSGKHGQQTAKMIDGIEQVLLRNLLMESYCMGIPTQLWQVL